MTTPRPIRNVTLALCLLCLLPIAFFGVRYAHQRWLLSNRVLELKARCADSLMERWAGERELHPRWTPWLDRHAKLERYREANRLLPTTHSGRILLYGDSLTDYWIKRAPDTFLPGRQAIGRGIAGQTTPELLWRLQQDALDLHPQTLVILAGTNDIVAPGLHIATTETHQNLIRMVETARQRGIQVVLCSLLPVAYRDVNAQRQFTPQIEALNAWIKGYAAGNHLTYVDYFSAMATPDGSLPDALRTDQLHPNPTGYRIMERVLEQALDTQK